jgi:hypothetical protein
MWKKILGLILIAPVITLIFSVALAPVPAGMSIYKFISIAFGMTFILELAFFGLILFWDLAGD